MPSKRLVTFATVAALILAALGVVVGSRDADSSLAGAVATTHYDLGVDRRSAHVDELIDLAVLEARRWNRDAVMVAISAAGVRADGTVDLEGGEPVMVWVVSPTRVRSLSALRRLEAIRVYRFTDLGLRADFARSGLGEGWEGWEAPAPPRCSVGELARALDLADQTFALRAERQPSAARPGAWRVEHAAGGGYYDMTDCALQASF